MPTTGIVRVTDTLKYTPKAFALTKTTTEYYLQKAIRDIILIIKDPPNTLPLSFTMAMQQKMISTRLLIFYKEAHPSLACKYYHLP